MENSDSHCQVLILNCLEAIKKTASPKKDKNLRDELQAAINILSKNTPQNANQYFSLFKQGFELNNTKLTESILVTIKVVFQYNLIDFGHFRVS